MKLFQRLRKTGRVPVEFSADYAAQKISGIILRVQSSFDKNMKRITQRLSQKKLKIIVILFFVSWGGASLMIGIHSFLYPGKQTVIIPQPISTPTIANSSTDTSRKNVLRHSPDSLKESEGCLYQSK